MKVEAIKTRAIKPGDNLKAILESYLPALEEGAIVAVTSKIVSLCQNRVVPVGSIEKAALIHQEAEYYIPSEQNKWGITLSIKEGILIPTAGIDESNGEDVYILWPSDAWGVADQIRHFLLKRHGLKKVGVVITDSKTTPLRRGTTGVAVSCSGFRPLKNYIGRPDIFGRKMKVTQANIMDGLAAAAVLAMGEGNERTPLAVMTENKVVDFIDRPVSDTEKKMLSISLAEDLYAPLVESEKWVAGQG